MPRSELMEDANARQARVLVSEGLYAFFANKSFLLGVWAGLRQDEIQCDA